MHVDPPSPSPYKTQAKLEDVALLAGVAKSTVSRVLMGEKTLNIRAETRQRVLDAVQTLGYRPNRRARSLRTSHSFSLGLVVPEIDNPAFTTIIQGAQRAALQRDYSLLIGFVDKHYPDHDLYRRLVGDNQVSGLLVTTVENPVLRQDLEASGVPYVLVNRSMGTPATTVLLDYHGGAQAAVTHLAQLGHRRIGYISGPLRHYTGSTRLAGFHAGLRAAGIEPDDSLVIECDYDREGVAQAMTQLLAHADGAPTAICAANVSVSAGILAGAARHGLRVPDDLSVLALLDSGVAEMLVPAVTAMRFPFFELGFEAANELIDMIEQPGYRPPTRTLAHQGLVQRHSTAAVGTGA